MRTDERDAILLDRMAVLRVVNSLRKYRAAATKLLNSRYRDGECDLAALYEFRSSCEEAEEDLGEEEET